MEPAPICTTTELLATPPTGCQFGLLRLSVLSRLNPVATASHEIVRLRPLRLVLSLGAVGGGGDLAVGEHEAVA